MKKLLWLIFIGAAVGGGCKKGYLDINNNPNNPDNAGPQLVLTNALNVTAARQVENASGLPNYTYASAWMGQWAPSGSYAISANDISSYKQTTEFGNTLWSNTYNNLEDYDYVEKNGNTTSNPFFEGAGKVMKAYEFQQLVDNFGDIPYSQALQATNAITPAYDKGQDIYKALFDDLTTAISLLKTVSTPPLSSYDALFGGDVSSWIQFANSLRLRLLVRQSQVAAQQSYISDMAKTITQEGSGYLTADAAVNPGYSSNKPNPFWAFEYTLSSALNNDYWRAAQFGLNFYKNNNDPRFHLVYGPTPGNDTLYQGNVLGAVTGNYGGPNTSIFGPGVLKSPNQSAVIMSAAESYFLQSEAALRGWIPGNAEDLYHDGIMASFEFLGVGDANNAAVTYYSQSSKANVYWNSSKPLDYNLNCIIAQKWAAENSVTPFETWCDYRRLKTLPFNASIPPSQNPNVLPEGIPNRIVYPTIEYQSNSTNVAAQGDVSEYAPKIWWMP